MKKKKKDMIQLDSDFSFEELVSRVANAKVEDVDEAMEAEEYDEDAPIDEESCEPPEEC